MLVSQNCNFFLQFVYFIICISGLRLVIKLTVIVCNAYLFYVLLACLGLVPDLEGLVLVLVLIVVLKELVLVLALVILTTRLHKTGITNYFTSTEVGLPYGTDSHSGITGSSMSVS